MHTLSLTKTYQKYSEYKDSGVEWLGQIPEEWGILPVRGVLNERKDKNTTGNIDNILSVMKDVGVIRYVDKGSVGNNSSDRPENYKVVYKNDIVINSMNLVIGSVGLANENGVTSSVYIIYNLKNPNHDIRYFYTLFRVKNFQRHLGTYGKGIMELRESIKSQDIKNQLIPVPSFSTQKLVSNFLDEKLNSVDQIIEKKKKLIELLKEKRTAVINKAVTRGLDPKVELVDSGIDWIGQIPGGWEIQKLKFGLKKITRGVSPDYVDLSNIKIINQACIYWDHLNLDKIKYQNVLVLPSDKGRLIPGDILMNSTGTGTLGRANVFNNTDPNYYADSHITIIRTTNKVYPDFLKIILETEMFQGYIYASCVNGSTNQIELSRERIKNIPIMVPNLAEQIRVAEFVNKKLDLVQNAIVVINNSILKLVEFKQSLISNVVTGKVKV